MARGTIEFGDLAVRALHVWEDPALVLTSGNFAEGRFNAMAVGWGSMGVMWKRPFVQVVVRPTRYTFEFMERYGTFTLCSFPAKLRKSVLLLGSKSGLKSNKIAEAGLRPCASVKVDAPSYEEAELVIECRKIYRQNMDPAGFLDPGIDANYTNKDYHRIYFGEVAYIGGEKAWSARKE